MAYTNSAYIWHTKKDKDVALPTGGNPYLGDTIYLHPIGALGRYMTNGISDIKAGDDILLTRGRLGEWIAESGGESNCLRGVPTYLHTPDPNTGGIEYYASLDRPTYIQDASTPTLIFETTPPLIGEGHFQFWYPYGAVWIWISPDDLPTSSPEKTWMTIWGGAPNILDPPVVIFNPDTTKYYFNDWLIADTVPIYDFFFHIGCCAAFYPWELWWSAPKTWINLFRICTRI
jgi:hypothetical protein